ncbi:hypothetical protein PAEPH01_2071, partial [Pancytospora epiphaga]
MAITMLKVLQEILDKGKGPKNWEIDPVTVLYKKGATENVDNYRGITLITTLCKIMTKILTARIRNHCEEENLIRIEQIGFTRNEERLSQAAALIEIIERRKTAGKTTVACFIDLRKTYDLVSHDLLFEKLQKAKIGKKVLEVLKSLYTNARGVIKGEG